MISSALVAAALLVWPFVARWANEAPADTFAHDAQPQMKSGDLLKALQRQDFEFYPDDILEIDTAFQDSVVSRLNALGLEAFEEEQARRAARLRTSLRPSRNLLGYDRVNGLTLAASLLVRPRGATGLSLRGEWGRAFSAGKFRYQGVFQVPLGGRHQEVNLRVHYADRIQPYGSNRPFANSLRSLLAGDDEQDYLKRRGGGVEMIWKRGRGRVSAGYEANEQRSVGVSTDRSLFGSLDPFNRPIDEGTDRSVLVALEWGQQSPLTRARARVAYRVAGDALGGDFAYNRADVELRVRKYVGRFEFVPRLHYVRTGGGPPVQQLADIGGLSTVRGFPRRSRVGRQSLALRSEILVPYDILRRLSLPLLRHARLQFVPFVDAARVFNGTSDRWAHSVGLGVQQFVGFPGKAANVRLDIAVPLGPKRPADVHLSVGFAAW